MNKVDLINEWLAYSDNDMRSAEYLTTLYPQPLEIICFHCQQAAEKALKAFLVSIDIRPPKTHDLSALMELCGKNIHIGNLKEEVLVLNDYSVITRYPGDKDLTSQDKDEALNSARKVINVVKKILEP